MKKLSLFLVSILLIIPFAVKAASPSVKTLDATVDSSTIKYSGTMEDGSYAVMCKLYKGDDEIDLLSSAVDNNKFEGEFTVSSKGEYKIHCANYEGGEIKNITVSVDVESDKASSKEDNKSNPKTGDKVMIFVSMLVVSIIGFGITVVLKKRKINC